MRVRITSAGRAADFSPRHPLAQGPAEGMVEAEVEHTDQRHGEVEHVEAKAEVEVVQKTPHDPTRFDP
jgi:hypothetical protein